MDREKLTAYLQEKFGDKIEALTCGPVEPFFLVKNKEEILQFCKDIRDDLELQIDYLCAITAVDTTEKFEIIYSVASVAKKIRFDYKVILDHDNPEIDSVIDAWAGADWYEREIWELYGVKIKNHPSLGQFLLPDDWNQGHPMRRDWDAPDFIRMPEF